jgi:uncharacterized protein YjbJ (UPF0337 family)
MTEPIKTPTPATAATNAAAPSTVHVSWNDQKAKLKAQFSTLTDEDLRYDNGKKDEMMARVQTKVGKTKEELAAILAQ